MAKRKNNRWVERVIQKSQSRGGTTWPHSVPLRLNLGFKRRRNNQSLLVSIPSQLQNVYLHGGFSFCVSVKGTKLTLLNILTAANTAKVLYSKYTPSIRPSIDAGLLMLCKTFSFLYSPLTVLIQHFIDA